MRILVYEFISGGGMAGRPVPPSLAVEGAAMRTALSADLAAAGHQVLSPSDSRYRLDIPYAEAPVWERPDTDRLDALLGSVDAAWIIAPETGGCLRRLTERAERVGCRLLGSSSSAIRTVSDKARLGPRLLRAGISTPATRVLVRGESEEEWARSISESGVFVVKPRFGAGGEGVRLAESIVRLDSPESASMGETNEGWILQEFVPGEPASVALLCDGRRAFPLTLQTQNVRMRPAFAYSGGVVLPDHPLKNLAFGRARRAAEAVAGLRGWVGVDLVLTRNDAVVIEINPRLTTAYLGVRRAIEANVAEMALAAAAGRFPSSVSAGRSVRFTPDGKTVEVGRPVAGAPGR